MAKGFLSTTAKCCRLKIIIMTTKPAINWGNLQGFPGRERPRQQEGSGSMRQGRIPVGTKPGRAQGGTQWVCDTWRIPAPLLESVSIPCSAGTANTNCEPPAPPAGSHSPCPSPALPQQRCQGRGQQQHRPPTCQALKMAFLALVAQPPCSGHSCDFTCPRSLSFLVLCAPGKYSRLKATGVFFSHTTVETVTELYLSESQ